MAPEQLQGRQSPDPEHQTAEQQNAPPASDPNSGAAPSEGFAQDSSKKTLEQLPSNPEHILAKAAEEKTAKK
jgi:hypothetical protein